MNIENMLPFLNEQALNELVDSVIAGDVDFDIRKALPFLEDDALKRLMEYVAENPGKIDLDCAECYPLMSEEIVEEVFLKKLDSGILDAACLPFVSSECLKKVIEKHWEDSDWNINVDALYPFMDEDDISELFRAYLKRNRFGNVK